MTSPAKYVENAFEHAHEADDRYYEGWRQRELSRIERAHLTYVDYTGAAPLPESLVQNDGARLASQILGNPHSQSGASLAATADVDAARAAILHFLNADPDEYTVVLTSNATAACRLVGESFPFGAGSVFALAQDNHNSVNGIREYAQARGAAVHVVPIDQSMRLGDATSYLENKRSAPSLFAFPAQSNFSGVRHPLGLLREASERGWRTLLDAAAFLPTADLDLRKYHPDFVCLSLYKIAGYPTGVGALVARSEALAELRRPAFSGGTVQWVTVAGARHRLASGAEGFEDGTLPFLALGAVAPALAVARAAERERLGRHLRALTMRFLDGLAAASHDGGAPRAIIYGPRDVTDRGSTIAFNLLDNRGAVVPHWEVEHRARDNNIALRAGCFCNPGCSEQAFAFEGPSVERCLDHLGEQFTVPGFGACMGEGAVGALRVSFGLGSLHRDVDHVLRFIGAYPS